jgi:hypothetical protein
MPKYYVSIPGFDLVLNATDPMDACVKTALRCSIVTIGALWKVSEIGFGGHPEDEVIDDHEVVKEINRRKKKK